VKRWALLERDLTQESGELTPTLKVKRRTVHTNHADVIERLYS
jgi:long-chain acyl-CoA synthetase